MYPKGSLPQLTHGATSDHAGLVNSRTNSECVTLSNELEAGNFLVEQSDLTRVTSSRKASLTTMLIGLPG